eukprot:gene3272-4122_t
MSRDTRVFHDDSSDECTLLHAWRKHGAEATIHQLSDVDSMREHIRRFPQQAMSKGLRGTEIDGVSDVHNLIADKCDTIVAGPTSHVLELLANETRTRIAEQIFKEATSLAKEDALQKGETNFSFRVMSLLTYQEISADGTSEQVIREIESNVANLLTLAGYTPKPPSGYCARGPYNLRPIYFYDQPTMNAGGRVLSFACHKN